MHTFINYFNRTSVSDTICRQVVVKFECFYKTVVEILPELVFLLSEPHGHNCSFTTPRDEVSAKFLHYLLSTSGILS